MTSIPYNEALKAVRKQRMDHERFHGRFKVPAKHHMRAGDRDVLGALFHAAASELGEPHDYPGLWGIEYHIPTRGGIFATHYAPDSGAIFGRFEHPELISLPELNPYSGKWNKHTSSYSQPQDVIDTWLYYLRKVLL